MPFKGDQWKQSDDWDHGLHSRKHTDPEVTDDDHGIGPFGSIRRGEYPPQEEGIVHLGRSYEQRLADEHGPLTQDEIDAINEGREISEGAYQRYLLNDEDRRAVARDEKARMNPGYHAWE